MSHHEQSWLQDSNSNKVLLYKRYVDDIFCLFENISNAESFLNFLNSRHPSIKLTMETEVNKKLPFLDVLITSCENDNISQIYTER